MKSSHLIACLLSLTTCAAPAAEDLVSGPPAGTKLTAVKCYANSGPYAGREEFDAAKEVGDRPGAFLFIHVLNRNSAPVIRGVNNLFTELQLFGFKGFVVMLSDDRTASEEQMKRVNGSLRLRYPMVLSLDGLDGPGNLALNRRCTLSLVVVSKAKVTKSFGFTDTGLHDMERIRESLESAVGDIPTTPAELRAIAKTNLPKDEATLRELAARQAVDLYRAQKLASQEHANSQGYPGRNNMRGTPAKKGKTMQRGNATAGGERSTQGAAPKKAEDGKTPAVTRRGAPPTDPQLNSLLRSCIRRDNSNETVDEVFGSIEKRAGESKDLGKEAIAMFQLMLSYPDRYGSDYAQKLAKKFLTDRGEK